MFVHTEQSIIYVSPDGTGDGSSELTPTELQNALSSSNVIAGDTIVLLDGTYTGYYTTTIKGDSTSKIIIKPYATKPIIDGGLMIGNGTGDEGSYITLRNIWFTNSNANRGEWTDPQGSNIRPAQISCISHHVDIINNYVHDGGVGIGGWTNSHYNLIYGNVTWNNGWPDDTLGGAECVYFQGTNKILKHNIFAGAFKRTFAGYGTYAGLEDMQIEENVIFAKRSALAGSAHNTVNNIIFTKNNIINSFIQGGYTYPNNGGYTMTDNIVYGPEGFVLSYFSAINASGNKFISTGGGSNGESFTFVYPESRGESYAINNNIYIYTGAASKPFEAGSFLTFAEWQALGYDVDSSFDTFLPSVNETFVYSNEYPDDFRCGIVVIWNWEGLTSVAVDLSDLGLMTGNTYRWRQAQDPEGDTDTFVYDGNPVSFGMTAAEHSVAYPTGFDELLIENQFPVFGTFIIEKI